MYQVLIVDDEKLMRDALSAMVSKVEGFRVACCVDSGEEAVAICGEEKIHIVFMDIVMSGMSGIEASKKIYALDPSVTIYIISAYNSFEYSREALSAKVREYISKPVSFSIVARLLEGYKQSQSVEESLLSLLLQSMETREYGSIHTLAPSIVKKVFQQESRNMISVRNRFLQIGQGILRAVDPVGEQNMDVEKDFPMNDVFGRESISWTFWLFDIMDYAFRQTSIQKCEHLDTVFDYIDDRIKEDINLSRVSDECAISQSYLSKLFKQHLGISVMEYIHLRKIKHAKMYLVFTDLSMADIAYHMGYNGGSYFCKVFKKFEGITPQQYKSEALQT